MQVKVNEKLCIGCGACAAIAPEIFELDSEGKAKAKAGLDQKLKAKAEEAAESCPVQAITVLK